MTDKVLQSFFYTNKITPSKPFQHHCTENCKLWRQPNTNNYVCTQTYSVHVCGEFCNRCIPSRNNEGLVCPLTGIVVGSIFPVVMQPGSMGGPGDIKCVLSTIVRRTSNSTRRDDSAIKRNIDSALAMLYRSEARRILSEKKEERMCRFIKKELRRGQSFTEINAQLTAKYATSPYNYCLSKQFAVTLKQMSSRILKHWCKFKFRPLKKIIFAFVGALITLLGTGRVIDGVTLYPRVEGLQLAQPDEADLGPLLNVSCRNITKMIKNILSMSVHSGGMPKPEFIFQEESTQPQRQTLVARRMAERPHQKHLQY